MPQPLIPKKLKLTCLWRLIRTSITKTKKKKKCISHHRELGYKVGSQEIPGVTGKFGLGIQNEAGQKVTVFFFFISIEHTGHSKHPQPTIGKTKDLFKKIGDIKGIFHARISSRTRHPGVWSEVGFRSITATKASRGDKILDELPKILKDNAARVLQSI